MVESADSFDAVIAALAARAVFQGNYNEPISEQLESARVEGCICSPSSGLQNLLEVSKN
jgi:hypothetical protein